MSINWPVILLALSCEYIDSSLGMGYGTTLTPILLLAGFAPVQVVPSILLSEFVTALTARAAEVGLEVNVQHKQIFEDICRL